MAVSIDGKLFVWGRNDKAQLGVGLCKDHNKTKTRRIVFKPKVSSTNNSTNTETKVVELPSNKTNIEVPSIVRDVEVHIEKSFLTLFFKIIYLTTFFFGYFFFLIKSFE